VASTKRKRRTKHRGNAAGIVETRGRTGRKPTEAERKAEARKQRFDRFAKPPTWRGSLNRAAIAAVVFVVVAILLLKIKPAPALLFGVFMAGFYTPMTYYMDSFMYRRRQAKLLEQQGKR
jgi:Flp pilus assembly protein TadB